MSPRLASTSAVSTLRLSFPQEGTASTLRITSLAQSQRARTPTVFRSKRQPAVAHNSSQQVKVILGLAPTRGWVAAVMCQTSPMLKKRIRKGKRDRDLESVRTLSEKKDLHVYFEQKADLAVPGECAAQKTLSEAEAEMDIRNWRQRIADTALNETNREL